MYIDEGKPVPGLIETTVKNLREVASNWYFTVPKGYEALLPYLRADAQLRNTFFRRLKVLWFAGAALSQSVFDEMQELALAACGERIMSNSVARWFGLAASTADNSEPLPPPTSTMCLHCEKS